MGGEAASDITSLIQGGECRGNKYNAYIWFLPKADKSAAPGAAKTSVEILDPCFIRLPDGRTYNDTVGNLGLGGYITHYNKFEPDFNNETAILYQLKKQSSNGSLASIGSLAFAFHMGSAAFNQSGSATLGGYEQNRALGPVGLLNFHNHYPWVLLEGVTLGVELGHSPFGNTGTGSVYQGTQGDAAGVSFAALKGARPNEAVVVINPSVPYIYLPYGTCEAAADNLPVTWNKDLGLFLWNTEDPLTLG